MPAFAYAVPDDEFEDLMCYPKEIYHPLREDEWQLIQFIAEQNIQLYDEGRVINKNLLNDVFVRWILYLLNVYICRLEKKRLFLRKMAVNHKDRKCGCPMVIDVYAGCGGFLGGIM